MKTHEPTAEMKIVAKIERVQPVCVGIDAKGEIIWEGQNMPEWQRRMFPILYKGDFRSFWMRRAFYEATGVEMDTPSMRLIGSERREKAAAWGD